nr:MAG: ORF1 [TTV-like mini virus]
MPFYWRRRFFNPYYKTKWRRKRRPIRRRYFRTTFRRRYGRRQTVRRRRRIKKKLSKIKINQWQPKHIRKCKIQGDIALFICGNTRQPFNFTLFKESYTPVGNASGGSWSIQQFTLDCLYEEYIRYRNFWTTSNEGLPFVKYTGATLKFYKSRWTDYIATINLCPPFSVTRDMYLNTQPQRQLMIKKKIIVPQLTHSSRKRYKKVRVKPPALMQSKWYFQQDLCKIPLMVLTVAACSFEQPYVPEDQISNNITLYTLNTEFFQNPDFTSCPVADHGYVPKHAGTLAIRLFGSHQNPRPTKWSHVLPLTRTNVYTAGNEHNWTKDKIDDMQNYGNPFSEPWSHKDSQLYYTTEWPTKDNFDTANPTFTPLEYLYQECRYNPDKDTGLGNKVYLKPNNHTAEGTIYTEPSRKELIIEGYPLWIIFHAWSSWLEASKAIQDHFEGYFFVVVSKFIYPPKPCYIFLDKHFRDGHERELTDTDLLKWHPKYGEQTEVEYYFDTTGPYSCKINRSSSVQANLNYQFYFKWGGCPAPMEHIISPCQQDKFPIPNPELQTFEIQDPKTDKSAYLYNFDERRGQITKKCAERIKKDSTTELSITGISSLHVPVQAHQEESDQTETEEEEEPPLQQQLKQLRQQQRLLRHQLHRITKRQKLE